MCVYIYIHTRLDKCSTITGCLSGTIEDWITQNLDVEYNMSNPVWISLVLFSSAPTIHVYILLCCVLYNTGHTL